jgi:hypothetical protein
MATQTSYPTTGSGAVSGPVLGPVSGLVSGPTTNHVMIENSYPRSLTMNLINEALARARMRSPQNITSEAMIETRRSARRIAIGARRSQARAMGHLPPLR